MRTLAHVEGYIYPAPALLHLFHDDQSFSYNELQLCNIFVTFMLSLRAINKA